MGSRRWAGYVLGSSPSQAEESTLREVGQGKDLDSAGADLIYRSQTCAETSLAGASHAGVSRPLEAVVSPLLAGRL